MREAVGRAPAPGGRGSWGAGPSPQQPNGAVRERHRRLGSVEEERQLESAGEGRGRSCGEWDLERPRNSDFLFGVMLASVSVAVAARASGCGLLAMGTSGGDQTTTERFVFCVVPLAFRQLLAGLGARPQGALMVGLGRTGLVAWG